MIVGGYTLHLYCCCAECTARAADRMAPTYRPPIRAEFAEHNERETFRAAKARGWQIDRKGGRCWAPGHKRSKTDQPARSV